MDIIEFRGRLKGVKGSNGRFTALCPAHDDRAKNSLSVGTGPDGRILLECFSGCTAKDIVSANWERAA